MGAGAFIEPLVVISLLVGGTLVNKERRPAPDPAYDPIKSGGSSPRDGLFSPSSQSRSPSPEYPTEGRRTRTIRVVGWQKEIHTPNTEQFSNRLLSRLLRKFPFLVEVWYWALIYWVYQLGRAFTALTLVEGTVHTARKHALQVIHLEERLQIFWEPAIQGFFLQHPEVMRWINRIYSFIHIPGTILFLIWLFYITVTVNRTPDAYLPLAKRPGSVERSPGGSALYQARRRTMAMCNLIAFVVFTLWPCMPPRLLSDPEYHGPDSAEAKSFGFVDTVHGAEGESSVWTQNKFCNQYAAMPSLHFGYSLLIGLTIALIPLASQEHSGRFIRIRRFRLRLPTFRRLLCVVIGFAYPATILTAIIATANHFILDAVAGGIVCGIAWNAETFLLNLLPLEDCFLWCLRIHKPNVDDTYDSAYDRF
ncbi:hypothetical protein D9758_009397 [Tetrapyrgos nigripes]|uniref:Inositolphosphotransferase Aur1/Ipt1 domain-containing protein n=1 Tax=Tetrapyrgos nigripes TaxID=182062 RepID=A0A8H5D1S3_9AGAR|nr:hypothetical protein D9758_009397 [Tetrapyrgos nigripes]